LVGSDPDVKVLTAIARQITYGSQKKRSFLRVEPLPGDWTFQMASLVQVLRLPKWLHLPAMRMGPSGIMPAQPAFAPVLADAFFCRDTVFRVGAEAGGLSHGAAFRDSPSGPLRFGVLAGRPVPGAEHCELLPCEEFADIERPDVEEGELPMCIALISKSRIARLCRWLRP
jgi:hypothetical protein